MYVINFLINANTQAKIHRDYLLIRDRSGASPLSVLLASVVGIREGFFRSKIITNFQHYN